MLSDTMELIIKETHSLYGNQIFLDNRMINPFILEQMKDKDIKIYSMMEGWGLMAHSTKKHYLISFK